MITYDLFPTLVASDVYPAAAAFKEAFFNDYPTYEHVDLHHRAEFDSLFRYINGSVCGYLERLIGKNNGWQPWISRTWFSDCNVSIHDHADAHLTFVYYVNVPDGSAPIRFLPPHNWANDLTKGMFDELLDGSSSVTSPNKYNCSTIAFAPQEGHILVFPSTMKHAVFGDSIISNDVRGRRISIAGDVILTLKHASQRPRGLQPISNWKSFS